MKNILTILFLVVSQVVIANSYTLGTLSGGITISNTTTSPSLVGDDTLFIPATGTYSSVQLQNLNGTSGHFIHIIFLGTNQITSPASFQQPSDFNSSYVKIDNEQYYNWYGHLTHSYLLHDITYSRFRVVNPTGSYKNQPFETWDDAFASTSMVFTGSKSQTFYNIQYLNCKWEGYADVTPLSFGSQWGSAGETKRSICTDITMAYDTFNHITATSASTPAAIYATAFNMVVHHSQFTDVAGVGSSHSSHNEAILWYGSGDAYDNYAAGNYAQFIRAVPLSWNGLAGYVGATVQMRFWNNIIYNQLSYSPFEIGQNNKGNRTSGNGLNITRATVVFNTIYRTVRASYNPPGYYYGYVCDDVNQDTLDVSNNLIMLPENDYTYDASGRNNYTVAVISASPAFLTNNGNKPFATWTSSITQDTVSYIPSTSSALLDASVGTYSFRTTDYYGNAMNGTPDVGAVERQASGSPPGCASYGTTTGITQTTATANWTAGTGTTVSFDVQVNGTTVGNTTGLFYNLTGLTANSTVVIKVIPINTFGSATGCSTTSFTTLPNPPSCTTNGTVTGITQTTATLPWTAAATATSYDVYIGGSLVGNTASTSWSATGLTANSSVSWYVVPKNSGGAATGCSGTATSFNTLPNAPGCTTNLTPTNGSTVVGTTSATFTWNAASGATSYQFWLDGALVTAVGGTTYNGFGYSPGSTHTWYVRPTNSGGTASGCTAFTFTTAVTPTVMYLKIKRR